MDRRVLITTKSSYIHTTGLDVRSNGSTLTKCPVETCEALTLSELTMPLDSPSWIPKRSRYTSKHLELQA